MIWIKSVLTGFAAGILTVIAIIVGTTTFWMDAGQGAGGIGFFSFGISELLLFPFTLAFVLGFRWMFRRHRRHMQTARSA